jgi:hypothetical protein
VALEFSTIVPLIRIGRLWGFLVIVHVSVLDVIMIWVAVILVIVPAILTAPWGWGVSPNAALPNKHATAITLVKVFSFMPRLNVRGNPQRTLFVRAAR